MAEEEEVAESKLEAENEVESVPNPVEAFIIDKPNIKDDEKSEKKESDEEEDDPEELDKLKKYLLKRSQNK